MNEDTEEDSDDPVVDSDGSDEDGDSTMAMTKAVVAPHLMQNSHQQRSPPRPRASSWPPPSSSLAPLEASIIR
jgi:hypothetical protein